MTSQMDIDHDVPTILATLRMEGDPELAPLFYTMEDLWERKLWHQLTQTLKEFYADSRSEPLRLRVFTQFIRIFQNKISQLSLVNFGLLAASQCKDPQEALVFLTNLAEKVDTQESWEAHLFATIEIARVHLALSQTEEAQTLLSNASKTLEKHDSLDPVINASYYDVSAELNKTKADFTAYYRNALLYLACINLNKDLTVLAQQQRAYDLSIAAILGDKIYNFGELLLHPILDSLRDGEYQWLLDLLFALNDGNVNKFESLSKAHISKQPILKNSLPFLRQKICLTALTEAVFKRPTSNRTLTFETIAHETRLSVEEVEHLVMKALSLGLLRGFIDQVSQTVTVTWLQPRVLNRDNIENMRTRLVQWDNDVKSLSVWMENEGKEVWTYA